MYRFNEAIVENRLNNKQWLWGHIKIRLGQFR